MASSTALVLYSLLFLSAAAAAATPNYADAFTKCLLFYEGQRSGKLPPSQRLKWRKDSALKDGQDLGVDLTGGYYDAGDNVKFGLPMAFTATVLAWSIVEFGGEMGHEEWQLAAEALSWNTDYLLKATAQLPDRMFVQVGDPISDHNCWERPEDMDTLRTTYQIDAAHPGSEVAGETAAALAAASLVFRSWKPSYAAQLLARAKAAYDFADKHQGSYNSIGGAVCPFYCDYNGYQDELAWAAAWLNKATGGKDYQEAVRHSLRQMHLSQPNLYDRGFSWDNKNAGINMLLHITNENEKDYSEAAKGLACSLLPDSPIKTATYTPAGLLYVTAGCNLQAVTALSFLLLVYARHLGGNIQCGNAEIPPSKITEFAKSQVDYLLGSNPQGMSYMVGYGAKFPQYIHHRASSLPSMDQHPQHIACHDGSRYFELTSPNPNVLTGAVVGGPNDGSDNYNDTRWLPALSEPTTYVNAPLVGLLAYFSKHG